MAAFDRTDSSVPSHHGVVLITGGSKGLGRALAEAFAARGASLVLCARDEATLREAAGACRSRGAAVVPLAGDVADDAFRRRLAGEAGRAFGRIDLLINNASTLGPTPLPPLLQASPEALHRAYEVNLVAPLRLVTQTLPWLGRSAGPTVVNVTSDAALGGYPGWGVYGASKAALELASRTLAGELAGLQPPVAVCWVDPGDMDTEMHRAAEPDADPASWPTPERVVPFFLWLADQPYDAVNGRRFEVRRWLEERGA
ncbi:SDR family NAD(P)-dependent oxidoreductase [Limnochorda pilosa]|uniref:Short-chain dehydrogenase n=1 Tax=Limnochorda pilosa TaxID=1555112 RepID=A0A0K2SP32_LIMPI|nr:SDR family oxidoreductase [Limnochorda pilosa]BAS28584.1 short-chain dehydrogenase [Limnochorda pilosa]